MLTEEFRRCLVDLDVEGIKKLWSEVSPHLPQSSSDSEVIYTLHLARVKSDYIPVKLKEYSEQWLKEHQITKVVSAVGISVNSPAHRAEQAKDIHEAMKDSVLTSIKSGMSLEEESGEIFNRMQQARDRVKGI